MQTQPSSSGKIPGSRKGAATSTHGSAFAGSLDSRYSQLPLRVLMILNTAQSFADTMTQTLKAVKECSCCEAIGIRLRAGIDYPYFAHDGFSESFILAENSLLKRDPHGEICMSESGNPQLECTCGLLLSGAKGDQLGEFFTSGGSCWTNDSREVLKLPADQDPRLHARNRCIHEGYLSIALVPVRAGGEVVGLLQLNSRQQGMFTATAIRYLELVGHQIGETLLRKQVEDNLRNSQQKLSNLINNLHAGIVIHAPDTRITFANIQASKLLGLSPDQMAGKTAIDPAWSFLREDGSRLPLEEYPVERVLQDGQSTDNIVLGVIRPQAADRVWVLVNGYPEFKHNGDLQEIVITFVDVTERKEAELALQAKEEQARKLAAMAEAATRAKSTFLANMSHDIRTPMNGILGTAELLAGSGLTADQRELVDILSQSGKHLLSLINDILDLSRIESGQLVLRCSQFNFADRVHSMLTPLVQLAKAKGLYLNLDIDQRIPATTFGDAERIAQILTNLVGNALKFTRQGGIDVRCTRVAQLLGRTRIRISVTDTGIGIPVDKIAFVEEPFAQLADPHADARSGTGLGLSICKQLLQLMNSRLEFNTPSGGGTQVSFVLELGDQPPLATGAVRIPAKQSGCEAPIRAHLLLVEDNADNANIAQRLIQKTGATVVWSESASLALQLLRENRYDAVLMDCRMPGMDGFAATREIRNGTAGETNRHIPIIAQTANAMPEEIEGCLACGMNATIIKPLSLQRLREVLKQVLGDSSV